MSSSNRRFRRRAQVPPPPRDWPPGDTKTTLVADLEQKPQSVLRDRLIGRAKAGHYHDFETPLAMPKVTLYKELSNLAYTDLAQKVRDGGYDHEPPTEAQKEELVELLVGEKGPKEE